MERQMVAGAGFLGAPPRGVERGKLEGFRAGRLAGKIEGFREGELKGTRAALLRLAARAGIALAEGDRVRILACTDRARLDGWIDNILGAKTAADVLA